MLKLAVLISGGGSNLKALLDAAADPAYPARVVAVGSDTDAAGLAHAEAAGVPTFIVRPRDYATREEWGQALAAAIREHGVSGVSAPGPASGPGSASGAGSASGPTSDPDPVRDAAREPGLVVSAGLMRILPAGFVRAFSPNLINTHPALLPLFPGAHAVRDALVAGATETGVTVHVIDEGVDTGPALRRAAVQVRPGETEEELHERIKQLERPLLVETVREIAAGELDLRIAASGAVDETDHRRDRSPETDHSTPCKERTRWQ
ncbi:phosphoribosylglycinamide formyltransferase [Leucobacter sp. CSA1]|uniref:Phosphoribosylglycinamide formyltransferase n=1 Tax=Leucobacter chromiisoli TaxID=2796471 RepID=A0A934Q8C5_9MICO|nr:formyltransferase family protein [Leucobacter chromiisoli]MBK0419696.1 phosphoribosylglycinamide formyltransferase [Leucobacter chromiisoli]